MFTRPFGGPPPTYKSVLRRLQILLQPCMFCLLLSIVLLPLHPFSRPAVEVASLAIPDEPEATICGRVCPQNALGDIGQERTIVAYNHDPATAFAKPSCQELQTAAI